jgi:hypothetical protein
MSKRLIIILALAFVVGFAFAAYAEVQNVKVGGDLTMVGAIRNQLDLVGSTGTADAGNADAWVSIGRVKIDANLTDNIDVCVRLINERVWSTTAVAASSATAVDLDLAYVALKDFMKDTINTPVTMVLGRQEIKIGSGLLIGSPGGNQTKAQSSLGAGLSDLSTKKAFDAIVGVVDLSPVTLTAGFVKVTEGAITQGRDNNAYVVDAIYPLGKDSKDTVLEATYVLGAQRRDNVQNLGGRVTSKPIENLGVEAEYVYQTARTDGAGTWLDTTSHKTKASDAIRLAASYALPDVTWKPTLGVDFTRLSSKWNIMHEDVSPADLANLLFPNTDVRCIGLSVAAKPKDDLTLKLRYANLALAKKGLAALTSPVGTALTMDTTKKDLGNEYDLGLAYDYTADVQLGLNFGLFKPGKAFDSANRKTASQVVGSMKVTF